jgi:amino acid transporter
MISSSCTLSVALVLVAWSFANWVAIRINFRGVHKMVLCPPSKENAVSKTVDKNLLPTVYWGQLAAIIVFFCIYIHSMTAAETLQPRMVGTLGQILVFIAFVVVVASFSALCAKTEDPAVTVGEDCHHPHSAEDDVATAIKDTFAPNAALLAVALVVTFCS